LTALTLDRQKGTLNARHLLVGTLDQVQRRVNGLLITTVDQQQRALESLVLVRFGILLSNPLGSRRLQELREDQQLLLELSLGLSDRLSLCLLLDLLQLLAVGRCELLLELLDLCLILCVELLVLLHLLFESDELGLELWLLEGLGLLVLVEFALGDKVIKRDIEVLLDHSIGLGHAADLLVDCAHALDQARDVRVLGAAIGGLWG
jgi:hypothetical protein